MLLIVTYRSFDPYYSYYCNILNCQSMKFLQDYNYNLHHQYSRYQYNQWRYHNHCLVHHYRFQHLSVHNLIHMNTYLHQHHMNHHHIQEEDRSQFHNCIQTQFLHRYYLHSTNFLLRLKCTGIHLLCIFHHYKEQGFDLHCHNRIYCFLYLFAYHCNLVDNLYSFHHFQFHKFHFHNLLHHL